MNQLPISILRGTRHLTPDNLESSLGKEKDKIFNIKGEWREECKKRGLFVDLSQTRWVNLGCATQLTLLIESAKKAKIQVYVALPIKRLTEREKKSTSYSKTKKQELRSKRENTNNFLKVIQFDQAIKCDHIKNAPEVKITEVYEFHTKDDSLKNKFRIAFNKEHEYVIKDGDKKNNYSDYKYKHILPLTWINTEVTDKDFFKDFSKKFNEILDLEERKKNITKKDYPNKTEKQIEKIREKGISHIDVQSLKNVIISELTKNVREHAGEKTRHALMSIGLFPTSIQFKSIKDKKIDNFNSVEKEYFDFTRKNEIKHFIEIYYGDSGVGILNNQFLKAYNREKNKKYNLTQTKHKRELLKWSFNKWSTSKKEDQIRGTKGLYRINRIVNKYNGLFLIRNRDSNGGYLKCSYSSSQWRYNKCKSNYKNYIHPGTFLNIKLCPFKELKKFNFTFKESQNKKKWKWHRYKFESCNIKRFDIWAKNKIETGYHLLLIIDFDEGINDDKKNEILNEKLKLLSHYRHPNGIVVYIADDLGVDTVEQIVESTNSTIIKQNKNNPSNESINPNQEDIYDPVLVIEKNNNLFWYGGNQNIIDILNEVYKNNQINNLSKLNIYKDLNRNEKLQVQRHFSNDDSLVVISPNREIKFNFTNIPELFKNEIKNKLSNDSNNKHNIVTPKLKVIDKWYNIKDLLSSKDDSKYAYALAVYLKIAENKDMNFKKETYILIDHFQQLELAKEFARLAGINTNNIKNIQTDVSDHLPRRTKVFNEDDRVIILTTIISSSETIRRLVKIVKRDHAKPEFIICLANNRKYDICQLETWDEYTDILSIYQKYDEDNSTERKSKDFKYFSDKNSNIDLCDKYISPYYEEEDSLSQEEIENRITIDKGKNKELKEHIIKKKCLHYNHIGKYNGRHFTFYLDKQKIVNSELFITKIEGKISKWKNNRDIEEHSIDIIKPKLINNSRKIFDRLIEDIIHEFNLSDQDVISWNRDELLRTDSNNVIHINFGALTGNTINNIISKSIEVDNILIIILFSQFKNEKKKFYEKISSINVQKHKNNHQLNIFREKGEANVKIEFLYELPLSYYNPYTCPICEQKRKLNEISIDNKYLNEYFKDRKNRISIISRDKIPNIPCDFYYQQNKIDKSFELSSQIIIKMYEFNLLLKKALNNTQYRIKVYKYIFDVYENKKDYIKDSNSELYAFLYFLSNEINWLQREPLVFRDLRQMVANIAEYIATIKIGELKSYFKNLDCNCGSEKLSIRYKFAAITVLRSANKYKFCENISDMLSTSKYNGRYSNNLMQNLFYHLVTLFKNKYNRSIEYFNIISNEMKKIRKNKFNFDKKQQNLFNWVCIKNKKLSKLLFLDKEKYTSKDILKELKEEIMEVYKGHHPKPDALFMEIDFRSLSNEALSNLKKCGKKSEDYKDFKDIINILDENWYEVKEFIHTKIIPYLDALDEKGLLDSEIFENFKRFYIKYKHENEVLFEKQIRELKKNELNICTTYDIYHEYYDFINNLFIKYSNEDNIISNKLLKKLKCFPADVKDSFHQKFNEKEFNDILFDDSSDNYKVFYPDSMLDRYFHHIYKNIKGKLNDGKYLDDVTLEFKIKSHNKYIDVIIINNYTDKFDEEDDKGGLYDFKNDLLKYNGDLEHRLLPNNKYKIKITFLKW